MSYVFFLFLRIFLPYSFSRYQIDPCQTNFLFLNSKYDIAAFRKYILICIYIGIDPFCMHSHMMNFLMIKMQIMKQTASRLSSVGCKGAGQTHGIVHSQANINETHDEKILNIDCHYCHAEGKYRTEFLLTS